MPAFIKRLLANKPLLLFVAIALLIIGTGLERFFPKKELPDVLSGVDRYILVDHNSVALFEEIPQQYIDAAKNLRMLFIDRSVGGNITDGLSCLGYASISAAPNHCKRPDATAAGLVPNFAPNLRYDRSNWVYQYWNSSADNGLWSGKLPAFIDMATPQINNFDVLSFQHSYLEVMPGSGIDDSNGYFYNDPTKVQDVYDLRDFENLYPDKTIIYWTSSLSRGIGSPDSESFNSQMRQYAQQNNEVLFDVADIESHDPAGNPCYDNRDGVPFFNANGTLVENFPDDGLNLAAICKEYTSEAEGGHLGSMSTGKIRIAKAFWVLMAQIAGWNPTGAPQTTPTPASSPIPSPSGPGQNNPSPSPEVTNTAPIVNVGPDQVITFPQTADLTAIITDDGLPIPITTVNWTQVSGSTVSFNNPELAATTVTFPASGTYVLRATASDSELTARDDITITVQSPSSGGGDATVYWSFNANSVADDTGRCTNCVNHGATWTSAGKSGGAFSFNGAGNYIDIGTFNYMNNLSQVTFALWVKPAFDETEAAWRYLITSNTFSYFFLGGQAKYRLNMQTTTGNGRADMTGLNWDPNTWHSMVLTYDGSSIKLFWDGQLKTTQAYTGSLRSNTGRGYLGTSSVFNNFYSGLVDEVKIFNRVLTPSEISAL